MSMRATPTANVPSVAPGTRKGKTNAKRMTKLRVRLNTGQSSANPQTCQAFGSVIARACLAVRLVQFQFGRGLFRSKAKVQTFHIHRKRHGEVDVAFRDFLVEPFGYQRA